MTIEQRRGDLDFAVEVAWRDGRAALAYYQTGITAVAKPDASPVTAADRDAESIARSLIAARFPDDAILGEEDGESGAGAGRRWIVDPIDGTKNFVRGVPVWATLIALMVDGEVVVGCVSAPQLNRRWWASKDGGAWTGRSLLNATPCRVSDVSRLEDASLSYSSFTGWEHAGRLEDFLALSRRAWRTRAYGDFWSYMLVAEGAVDLAAEPDLEVYDMAALDVIVREAGGKFTSLAGTPGPTGGNALASNGRLHDAALAYLGSVGGDDEEPSDHRGGSVHELSARRRPPAQDEQLPLEPNGDE